MRALRALPQAILLLSVTLLCSLSMAAQDPRILHAQAETESNPEKQVLLLCKAADLDPKNKEYRRDCDVSRSALISADRQALKTAQDASDSGQPVKAKRYAKYVSALDPDLHKQAEQLLARLDTPATTSPTSPPAAQATGQTQSALLAQASGAYQSGNLAGARSAAQSVTDPSLRSTANQILTDIEHYSSLVSAGQRHEQAREYAAAESSYQAAFGINPHVAADQLATKAGAMRQLAASSGRSQAEVGPSPSTHTPTGGPPAGRTPATPPPAVSLQDKVKTLLDQAASLKSRNDSIGAGKRCKQVLDLDPANADAKRCLDDITAELNKDPVRLEKTLRDAIVAFYASRFEDAESGLNRYVGADSAKKKGAAYFYLGATEATRALLEDGSKRASRTREAEGDFKQARADGYQPIEKYVSARVLGIWKNSGL